MVLKSILLGWSKVCGTFLGCHGGNLLLWEISWHNLPALICLALHQWGLGYQVLACVSMGVRIPIWVRGIFNYISESYLDNSLEIEIWLWLQFYPEYWMENQDLSYEYNIQKDVDVDIGVGTHWTMYWTILLFRLYLCTRSVGRYAPLILAVITHHQNFPTHTHTQTECSFLSIDAAQLRRFNPAEKTKKFEYTYIFKFIFYIWG